MKKRRLNKNKCLIFVILLLLVLVPTVITVSKYVLEKNGTYSFTLKGTKFDGTNLVTDDSISYTDALVTLENPERGIFIQQDVVLSNPYTSADLTSALTGASNVKTQLATSTITLVRLVVYLDNYRSENISNDWLNALDTIMDSYRQDGYKVIVRFAYFRDDSSSDPDNFSQILAHMDQLEDFFNTNQDVIHAVELGFIGKWGESHSSNYATSTYRNQVLEKALEVIPSQINILVRRPEYYEDYFGQAYFDHKLGYSSDDKARVGIYNDGMLASDSDYGTYTGFRLFTSGGRAGALKWVDYLSKYTIMGGEVVHVDGNESFYTLTNAFADMKKMHVNFLNKDYHTTILNYFRNNNITSDIDTDYNGQNAYKYLKDKLGYRFLVTDVKTPNYNVKQGENLNFSFTIKNVGFGNLVRKRPVRVIIEKNNKYYTIDTEIDPRYWFSSEETTEEVVLKLPGNIEAGSWNIYIQLPDASASLRENEKYYIKFANDDVWNDNFYANKIGTFTVENKTNDSNNGMYQLNAIENLAVADTPLTVIRPVTIDGNITDATEWISGDVVYDMYSESVSMRSIKNDLYLYIDPNTYDPTTTYIRIYFSNSTSNSITDYKYEIENSYIYNYSNGSVGSQIGRVANDKGTGFEYKVPFSTLGISSISDIKGLKIQYINSSNWNKYDEYIVRLDSTNMIVDGRKSYSNEYESSDLFYNQDNVKIYMKIVDGYLYVYDEDDAYDISTTSRIDLYLGTDNPETFSNLTTDNFIFTYRDSALMCDNATNTCPAANIVTNADKGKNKGAEYKIPLSILGISSISELRNVKLNYKSGSSQVKVVDIPYKYSASQFTGKTVIVAEKPAAWTNVYAYLYKDGETTNFAWPGRQMYEIEGESNKYVLVLPNDIATRYVIFNKGSGGNNNQMPGDNYVLYEIKAGQHKIWDGTIFNYKATTSMESTNALEAWHSYPSAATTDNDIKFRIKILNSSWNVASKGVCVHVYSNENGNIAGSWPGKKLTLNTSTGFYEGTVTATGTHTNIRLIFNNCKNDYQYPASNGLKIKKGMTFTVEEFINSSSQYYYKYYVTDDNT